MGCWFGISEKARDLPALPRACRELEKLFIHELSVSLFLGLMKKGGSALVYRGTVGSRSRCSRFDS